MSDLGFLMKVRDVIATGWTSREYGRDAEGKGCDPLSDRAICWCLIGASCRVTVSRSYITNRLGVIFKEMEIEIWNDEPGRTQAEVLDLLDNKIKELSK